MADGRQWSGKVILLCQLFQLKSFRALDMKFPHVQVVVPIILKVEIQTSKYKDEVLVEWSN